MSDKIAVILTDPTTGLPYTSLPVSTGSNENRTASGTITGVQYVELNTAGTAQATIEISGTWTGTINFQYSLDGNWPGTALPVTPTGGGPMVTSTTANGSWTVQIVAYAKIRTVGATITVGVADVTLSAATVSSTVVLGASLPSGDNTIGRVKVTDGTDVLDIDGSGRAAVQNPPNLDVAASTLATAANQTTANTSLSSIDTKLTSQATAANQATANSSLTSILGQLDVKTSTLATVAAQTTGNTSLSSIDTKLSSQATAAKQDTTNTLLAAGLPTALVGGKLDINLGTSSITLPISAAVLPLSSGAAKDSTLTDGTQRVGGTVTVTGALTDTQLRASPVPVSGTVTVTSTTANQGTGAGAAAPWSMELSDGSAFYTAAKTGQFPTSLGQSTKAGSLSVVVASDQTVPVSGTVAVSNSFALDTTLAKLTVTQGAALGSNTQALMGGSVTTAAPSYTTGQISPFSLTTVGALRVDNSAVNQPVVGAGAAGAAVTGNPVLLAGSDGTNARTLSTDTAGRLKLAGYSFKAYTATTAGDTPKSGAGILHSISVAQSNTGSVTIYDNTAASGTIIWSTGVGTAAMNITLDAAVSTGITVVISTAVIPVTITYL